MEITIEEAKAQIKKFTKKKALEEYVSQLPTEIQENEDVMKAIKKRKSDIIHYTMLLDKDNCGRCGMPLMLDPRMCPMCGF